MSGVDEDYANMLLISWDKADEQVNHMICKERKASNGNEVKTHSRENHEYHLKRWGRCVYCDIGIPVVYEKEGKQ
jgi:hypothetical protein